MRVTILGSGTSIPKPDRASPGAVIEFEESTVLIDPSSGSLHRMARLGLPVEKVDFVVFSHFHVDHTGDLVPLLFALRNSDYFHPESLTLLGPPGLKELYQRLHHVYGEWIELRQGSLQLLETSGDEKRFGSWRVRSLPVKHTENSIGFRFAEGQSCFAYSGDTDYCRNLVELLKKAEVGLVECSHPTGLGVAGHLTPQLVAKAAGQAGVHRLILTHLYPSCDGHDLLAELRQHGFQGQAQLAFDGLQFEV